MSRLRPGDIYQQGSAARLAAELEARRAAAEAQWMQQGGLSPSGQVYRSPTGAESDPMAQFRAAPIMEQAPTATAAPQGPSIDFYNPRGIQADVMIGGNPQQSIVTGNPFFDVNTDFNQLEKERALKNQNDSVFAEQNNRRMGAIAEARNAADALRAKNLAAQGMTQEQIDMRMHPERFAQPVDLAVKQAQATDLSQRQGRGNLHAMAQKFMRNGLSPAQAYAAAMNVTPTTDPANAGITPSLPPIDPMRLIGTAAPANAMAAGQYAGGNYRSDNELLGKQGETAMRRDVGVAGAGNENQKTLLQQMMELLKFKQSQDLIDQSRGAEDRQQAIEWLQANPNAANDPNPAVRDMHQKMMLRATGDQSKVGNQNPSGVAQPSTPLSSAFQGGSSNPSFSQYDPKFLVGNPAAMQQWQNTLPESERAMRRAQAYVEAGMGGDPAVAEYVNQTLQSQDPNLFSGVPDYWGHAYGDSAKPGMLQWLFGIDPLAQRGADWFAQKGGLPADVALPHVRGFYNSRL